MNDKKCIKRNCLFFIITICCFVLTFVFLLLVILLAPAFSIDQGTMSSFEFFGECIRYFAVTVPYFISAIIYAIDNKKLTELSAESNNSLFKVSKVANIVMMTVIITMLIYAVVRLYYWS